MERKPLNDIVPPADSVGDLARLFDEAEAAPDMTAPIPAGVYQCVIEDGQLGRNHKDTDRFAIRFAVTGGPHAGRKLFHDVFLTKAAMPYSKPKLQALGIKTGDQLGRGLPANRICCAVTVAVRTLDSKREVQEVKSFVVTGTLDEAPNPFRLEEGVGK